MGKKDTTEEERQEVVGYLRDRSQDGKLKRGSKGDAARKFGLHRNTVSEIWRQRDSLTSQKKGRVGAKKKYALADVKKALEGVPQELRPTIRLAAAQVGIPKSSFADLMVSNELRCVRTRIKPFLRPESMMRRLNFALKFVAPEPSLVFHDFYDHVHIDEKWLYLSKDRKSVYITDNEKPELRSAQSKRFITKVMFLVAVARPRYDTTRNQWFDGRVGLWPYVETQLAKRASKNRAKGTPVTVPVMVDRARMREMLVEQVIPAIKAKWPGRSKKILIQQDNAGPHCLLDDLAVAEAGRAGGWDIELTAQPPNSPDFNALDLGYFASIQALQQTKRMSNIDELVAAVETSYYELDMVTLDNVFLTLMSVVEQCLLHGGGNNFPIPHMQKAARRRAGECLETLRCSPEAAFAESMSCYVDVLIELFF